MADDELIAEIEVKTLDGWREWLMVERRPGGVSISVETLRVGRSERRRDPEMGISVDDDCIEALVLSLQAART